MFMISRLLTAAGLMVAALAGPAQSQEKITYLFPAPAFLPAFGPAQLALGKGYFSQAGLKVEFEMGKGGIDVAKQLGAGNADVGEILAEAPIIVRPNGVPVRTVAVYGGRGYMQLVVRADGGINAPADIKGKKVGVMSFQDTATYYSLLGMMATAGLGKGDVNAQALGPTNIWKFFISGEVDACACVPDWIPAIQAAGLKIKIIPSEQFFPGVGPALGASDKMIAEKPQTVRKVVGAVMKGVRDIMADPDKSAKEFVSFVPQWAGKDQEIAAVFRYYREFVFPQDPKTLGRADPARLAKLQDFYLANGFIQSKTPVDQLYSNAFVE